MSNTTTSPIKYTVVFSILFAFLFIIPSFAQKKKVEKAPPKGKQIEIVNGDNLTYDESKGGKVRKIIGNVVFKQEDVMMYCDSAYQYTDKNAIDAFGRVHIQQGDSLNLYGDTLRYDGDTKKAILSKNVRLSDKEMTLVTEHLLYDMNTKIGNYNGGGKITNKDNTLTSKYGYYYSESKDFYFKKDVVLVNPDYTIYTDTLRHNTFTKISYFYGPTRIIAKNNLIYCENGWYNSVKDICQFNRNAYLKTDGQKLGGDSLYYDRKKGYGKAIKNVELVDSAEKIILNGDLAEYFELQDKSVITGKALLTQYFGGDTLFLHADTLKSTYDTAYFRIKKQLEKLKKPAMPDSIKDNHRQLYAYNKVKFYKKDMQGMCDSLVVNAGDSLMKMFDFPVLWSDSSQITGDRIDIKNYSGKIDWLYIPNNSFIASKEDSARYNQIKGKTMKGFFVNNEMKRLKVDGNGQVVYYVKEDNGAYIGVNKADCNNMMIYMKNNSVSKIAMLGKPSGAMHPYKELSIEDLILKDFKWLHARQPKKKSDIFIW